MLQKERDLREISFGSCLLVIFSFFVELLAQKLYRWMDDRGIVHFADSLHSIPEKYRSEAEKRFLSPSKRLSHRTDNRGGRRLFDRLILPHENG